MCMAIPRYAKVKLNTESDAVSLKLGEMTVDHEENTLYVGKGDFPFESTSNASTLSDNE